MGFDDPNDPNDSLTLGGNTLVFKDTAASAFPNWIDHFDTFDIDWSVSADGGATWIDAGTTKNQVYTFLDTPTTTLYHTVAHLATAPPTKGLSDPAAVVDKIWTQFADRDVRRVDGHRLTYWANGEANAMDTKTLLSDGNGQCGSWAEFFIDTIRSHGIAGAEKIYVESDYTDDAIIEHRDSFRRGGMLIKNWTFDPAGTAPPIAAPMTHRASEYADAGRVPAQGNADSPDTFFNHFLVRHNGSYYDPSYGIGAYASQADWEDAALSGFEAAKLIGFDPSGEGVYQLFAKPNTLGDEETLFQAIPMTYELP